MNVLRTPDERFRDLPGYDFSSGYVEVPSGEAGTLRVHYLDEGPAGGDVVLLLHGEPSWSYLYRKMIPVLTARGLRAVAPDLVGFGRSDKPAARSDYTYERHVGWMHAFVKALDLRAVTLVCQDWGGLIGLRLAAERPERFARIVAANTMLPTGDQQTPDAFFAWQKLSQEIDPMPIGRIVAGGCARALEDSIVAAYDAPFPDESFKAGARMFPVLVPTRPDDPAAEANRRAWKALGSWRKPFLTAFSDGDPITAGGDEFFQRRVPGSAGQPHTTIRGAGHFLQEDQGEELARVVEDFVASTGGHAGG